MYSIDTSTLLGGWVRYYPPDVFGSVWNGLKSLGNGGILVASEEVVEELAKKQDDIWKWTKTELTPHPMDAEIQLAVADILAVHQRLGGGPAAGSSRVGRARSE